MGGQGDKHPRGQVTAGGAARKLCLWGQISSSGERKELGAGAGFPAWHLCGKGKGLLELMGRVPPPFHQQRGPERLHPGGR